MNWYHFLNKATTTLGKKSYRLSPDTVMPTIIFTKCLKKNSRHLNSLSAKKRYSLYIKSWNNDLSKFPKLDTYRKIKSDYRTEPYILYVGIKRHQQALTRLRVRSHNLHIERGRHCRPVTPRNERLCNFCSLDQVDDEKHFSMSCKIHSAERQSLLEVIIPILKLDRESNTTELFLSVMGSKDKLFYKRLPNSSMDDFKSEINRKHLVHNISDFRAPNVRAHLHWIYLSVRTFEKPKRWSIILIIF